MASDATTTIMKWVVILALLPFATCTVCTGGTCAGCTALMATAPPSADKTKVKAHEEPVNVGPEKPAKRTKAAKRAPKAPANSDAE
jgi:hypothetical protein